MAFIFWSMRLADEHDQRFAERTVFATQDGNLKTTTFEFDGSSRQSGAA